MALLGRTRFAQNLLGIRYQDPSPLDFVDPFASSYSTLHNLSFGHPSSTIDDFDGKVDALTVLRRWSPKQTGNEAHTLYYQTILNLTGFRPEEVRFKIRQSYIDVCAKGKRKIGTRGGDFLKLEYKRRLAVPRNALVSQTFIYFTKSQQLVIKLPVDHLQRGVDYPISLLNVDSYHKRLNKALSQKMLGIKDRRLGSVVSSGISGGKSTQESSDYLISNNAIKVSLSLPENIANCVDVSMKDGCLIIKGERTTGNSQLSSERRFTRSGETRAEYYRRIKMPEFIEPGNMKWIRRGCMLEILFTISDVLPDQRLRDSN